MTLEELMRQQEADNATFEKKIAAIEAKLAGIDKQLRPEVISERTAKVREEAGASLNDLVIAMKRRAHQAEEMARVYTPEAELRLARFDGNDDLKNATIQMATHMRLERTSTAELIEHLEDAVAARNLAKVEAIRLEFNRRPDREEVSIPWRTTFAKLEFPAAVAARRTIGKIGSIAMFSEQRFLEAATGRPTNPTDRMTAARMARAA
ncbi:MAG: hypothetical protein ACOY4R_16265 [Pseudomonadota bacterium]